MSNMNKKTKISKIFEALKCKKKIQNYENGENIESLENYENGENIKSFKNSELLTTLK